MSSPAADASTSFLEAGDELADQLQKLAVDGKPMACQFVDGRVVAQLYEPQPTGDVPTGQRTQRRDDQIRNSERGYVWRVSDEQRVLRFLILGTDGGSYYQNEKELTAQNVAALADMIRRGKGALILQELEKVSVEGRAARQQSTMMALALCARFHVHDVRKAEATLSDPLALAYTRYLRALHKKAFQLLPVVCRIPTHLFLFVKYCKLVSAEFALHKEKPTKGWGKRMRDSIIEWYAAQSPEKLAMQVTKYANREGYTHRDLFRLTHPTIDAMRVGDQLIEYQQIYRFIVKGKLEEDDEDEEARRDAPERKKPRVVIPTTPEMQSRAEASKALALIRAAVETKKSETGEERAVELIAKHGLVREHLATELLNSKAVWRALLQDMPMTALMRNLAKITTLELFDDEELRASVCARLTDEKRLQSARMHPLSILLAHATYKSGHGERGKLSWTPNEKVVDALQTAFYASFPFRKPLKRRLMLCFDVSGSMTMGHIANSALSCRTASAALGSLWMHTEAEYTKPICVGFSHELIPLPYDKTWSLDKIQDDMDGHEFGSTDCAQPMVYAMEHKLEVDAFIVFTDSETYYGELHPFEALQKYRETSGIKDARLIVMGMVANEFTIADPQDPGMLDVVGFDSAVPELVESFMRGEL